MDEVVLFRNPSDKCRVMVSNLHHKVTAEAIYTKFKPLGEVHEIAIKEHRKIAALAKGWNYYIFVRFYLESDAIAAVEKLNDSVWRGQKLVVRVSAKRLNPVSITHSHMALPLNKCIDLSNYLFGFNNWNSEILELIPYDHKLHGHFQNNTDAEVEYFATSYSGAKGPVYHPKRPSYTCLVRITVNNVVEMNAYGTGHCHAYEKNNQHENAKKRAVSNAYRKAFGSLAVIRLSNGKMDVRDISGGGASRSKSADSSATGSSGGQAVK